MTVSEVFCGMAPYSGPVLVGNRVHVDISKVLGQEGGFLTIGNPAFRHQTLVRQYISPILPFCGGDATGIGVGDRNAADAQLELILAVPSKCRRGHYARD